MPSSLFQQFNNENNFQNQNSLINKFQEFRRTFQGNPRQMVEQLMRNGQMSQAQFNQLSQQANQFLKLLGKF